MAKQKPSEEFLFKLKPETADILFSLLSQQEQHCKRAAEEGHPSLLAEFQRIYPFYNALASYLGKVFS